MKRSSLLLTAVLALALVAPAVAKEKKDKKPAGKDAAMSMPGMSPEKMQEAMKLGMPSDAHKALEPIVGTFNYSATMHMTPDAAPMVSTGTSTNEWIFGGRFVRQTVMAPPMMGMPTPFEGMALTGYDNMRKEYQTLWVDNMMTGMMIAKGSMNGNVLSTSGEFSCPMTGETHRPFRNELRIEGADRHVYSAFDKDPQGKEFKSMEIVYTRAK